MFTDVTGSQADASVYRIEGAVIVVTQKSPRFPWASAPGRRRSCHCRLFQCPHLDASSDGFLPKTQKQEQIQAGKR